MKPIRIDQDGVFVFSSADIDDYGMPELYGYQVYRVVESREVCLATDYKFEVARDWQRIHRYNREARFKTTLLNILGERTNIPQMVLSMVRCYLKPDSKTLWNDTRAILKHYKMRKYYDSIPAIIKSILNIRLFPSLTGDQLNAIYDDFKALVSRYDNQKHQFNRKYFPNIRFIVLKLLDFHSIHPTYPVPFIRTVRKDKLLNSLWDSLLNR